MSSSGDQTFRIPSRPPAALWLAIMLGAVYVAVAYAMSDTTWMVFRVVVPVLMVGLACGVGEVLMKRYREHRARQEQANRGPDIERIP